jgi:purine-binding chemotaxis protein CheW
MALTLIFNLGVEVYGLEIDAIQEIVENPVLHYVPRAGGLLVGAINFHGQILAGIDLTTLLGFSGEKRDHRWVVLTTEFKSLALTVSNIQRIAKLDLTALQPPAKLDNKAIRGVADLDGMMINLLDANAVINKLEHIYAE